MTLAVFAALITFLLVTYLSYTLLMICGDRIPIFRDHPEDW